MLEGRAEMIQSGRRKVKQDNADGAFGRTAGRRLYRGTLSARFQICTSWFHHTCAARQLSCVQPSMSSAMISACCECSEYSTSALQISAAK